MVTDRKWTCSRCPVQYLLGRLLEADLHLVGRVALRRKVYKRKLLFQNKIPCDDLLFYWTIVF